MKGEVWKPVTGYEGLYEVSDFGRVRSRDMSVLAVNMTGRYPIVSLRKSGKTRNHSIHRIIAKAFLPNPENYPVVRHLNDDPEDFKVGNLAWGTHSDNQYDSVRNGTHAWAKKTHCPRGHSYEEFGYVNEYTGGRECHECRKNRVKTNREAGKYLSPHDPRHGSRGAYNYWGCRCDLCRKLESERQAEWRRRRRERKNQGVVQ